MNRIPRVIYNDDSCSLGIVDPTLHAPENIGRVLDYLTDTNIDRLCWCVYCSSLAQNWNSTRIENYFDLAKKSAGFGASLLRYNMMYSLYYQGIDYLPILIEQCHAQGKQFFASFRMNDCHLKSEPSGAFAPEFWRNNQDKRLWGIRETRSYYNAALDYSYTEVRNHVFDAIDEFVSRYEIDGVELDFMRQEWAFNPAEAWSKRDILTTFIARIRKRLQQGNRVGRIPELMIRIPAGFDQHRTGGFDVKEYMKLKLVDLVVAGIQNPDCAMNLTDIAPLGKRYRIPVFGDVECFPVRFTPNHTELTPEQIPPPHNFKCNRSIAEIERESYALSGMIRTNYGLDGVYLFNFPCWLNEIVLKNESHSPEELAAFKRLLKNIDSDDVYKQGCDYRSWEWTPLYVEALRPAAFFQTVQIRLGQPIGPAEQVELKFRYYPVSNPHSIASWAGEITPNLLQVSINRKIFTVSNFNRISQNAGLIPSGYTIGNHELWSMILPAEVLENANELEIAFFMPEYPKASSPYIYIHDLCLFRRPLATHRFEVISDKKNWDERHSDSCPLELGSHSLE